MEKNETGMEKDREEENSSSLSTLRRNEETANANSNGDQVPAGSAAKKIKNDDGSSNFLSEGQGQMEQEPGSEVKEGPIKDLPPEMLTKILENVCTKTLFASRLVNRNFSVISSGILWTRPGSVIHFLFKEGSQNVSSRHRRREGAELSNMADFVEDMKNSKTCLYSRFAFYVQCPSFFDHQQWISFTRDFAQPNRSQNQQQNQNQRRKIKLLNFRCSVSDVTCLPGKLGDVLLYQIPQLEEFSLDIFSTIANSVVTTNLFPPTQNPAFEINGVAAGVPQNVVQLPQLKILSIRHHMCLYFPGIIGDILKAAINLKTIRLLNCFDESPSNRPLENCTTESLLFLHSLGKLHLLESAAIQVNQSFLVAVQREEPNFSRAFKLQDLKLEAVPIQLDLPFRTRAANFISSLLESCKSSLRKLELAPLGFLPGITLPKFQNLTALRLIQPEHPELEHAPQDAPHIAPQDEDPIDQDHDDEFEEVDGPPEPFFFPRTRYRNNFPAVVNLDFNLVDCPAAFSQPDSIPQLPRVKTLVLVDIPFRKHTAKFLASMCPNLKNLALKKDDKKMNHPLNVLKVGREIWTHLPKLETLEMDVDVNLRHNTFSAFDSCFTGISEENCQRLYDFVEYGKIPKRNKWGASIRISESELVKKEHASILEMKDLKKLTLNPYVANRWLQREMFFTEKLMRVSQEFAFKRMLQLEFNGRKPEPKSC